MTDYYCDRPDNPWRSAADTDPAAAILAETWGDNLREVEQGHRRYPEHLPRLLAAVGDALAEADRWAALAPPDDWGESTHDTALADAGRSLREVISRALLGGGAG